MQSILDYINYSTLDLFIQGFSVSLVRPGILLFLLMVLWGGLGRGMGLPLLFWRPKPFAPDSAHPNPEKQTKPDKFSQFMVGMGVGALVWQVLLAGYIFEEFATNYTLDRPPYCEAKGQDVGIASYPVTVEARNDLDVGYTVLRFPRVDRDFGGRFRIDPLSFGALWGYAAGVGAGGFFVLVAFSLIALVYRCAKWTLGRIGSLIGGAAWTPFHTKPVVPPGEPRSIYLPLGFAVGAFLLSLVTWGLCATPQCQVAGQLMTTYADWGSSAGRGATVTLRTDKAAADKVIANSEKSEEIADARKKLADLKGQDADRLRIEEADKARANLSAYYPVYGAFLVNFLLISAFSIGMMVLPERLRLFTPAIGIVLVLNLWIFATTFLNYFSPVPVEFVLILLFGFVLIAGGGYKLKFPNLPKYYSRPGDLKEFYEDRAKLEANLQPNSSPVPKTVPLLGRHDIAYLHGKSASPPLPPLPPKPTPAPPVPNTAPKPRLAIVCVSGGGSRAAAWTMKVLTEIEGAFENPTPSVQATLLKLCEEIASENRKSPPDGKRLAELEAMKKAITTPVGFPYHVRLVTGASGGMIAGAYYVASLDPPAGSGVRRSVSRTQLCDDVCEDFLTPIVQTLVSRDLPSLLIPAHLGATDRGGRLEEVWTKAFRGHLDKTFDDMQPGEKAGWRPSLIFSPMMVEDGRQLFISNLDLQSVVRNSAVILGEHMGANPNLNPADADGRRLLSREGLEFFKIFPEADRFQLGTAARMSASFPYVLPAAYLPTNPPRRVVDAGYYDNYGVGIASSWLFGHMDWIRENTSGVVVIQIRDGASGESRRREIVTDSFPVAPGSGLHWLTGPPEGIWAFRQAAQSFRNDNLLHLLSEHFVAKDFAPNFLTTISFELQQGDDVSLNYTLTEGERAIIHDAAESEGFRGQIRALLEWWHGLPPA